MTDEQVEELITIAVAHALHGNDDGQYSCQSHMRIGRETAKAVMNGEIVDPCRD